MPPKRAAREALVRWLPYLAVLPFLPLVWGQALLHPLTLLPTSPRGDLLARFAPLRAFGFGALRAGQLPLWDPLILGGVPNLGGIESALLYPPNWLHLLLPVPAALNLLLALHLWLAAALAAFLARRLGAGRAGAALAGLAWALGGTVLPNLRAGHLTVLCALAWAPLVYAAFDGWLETRRRRWLAAAAAAFALQLLAGNPQTAYYTALGALVFAALRLPGDRRARLAAGCGAALVLGALIAAAQLLPAAAAARESPRMGAGYAFTASFSLPPENLLTLLAPYWLGGGAGDYFGRLYHWEACLFCGAAALLLSCACPAPRRRPLLGGALALLVLALGSLTPAHRLLYLALPGFSLFRGPAKFSAQALLLLCAAAGLGYDAVRQSPGPRRRLYPAALGLGLLLALGCAAVTLAPGAWTRFFAAVTGASESFVPAAARADPDFARYAAASAGSGLGLAAAALLAAAAALRWAPPRALWALAALELALFAAGQRALSPASQPVPPELERALAAGGEGRFMTRWTAHPNLGLVLGRPEVWGYDQLLTRRWAELAAWTQGYAAAGAGLYQPVERLTPRAALLGARWLYRDEPEPRVEEARPAPPRSFVARARPVAAGGALDALSAPGFDPRREAAVEAPAAALAPPEGFKGGSASVRAVSADELEVEADAPGGGVVVVADAFAAGWSARPLPGSAQRRYEVVPADHALRGVPVGPGRHRFRLAYEPPGWRLGLALSALGLLALAALAFSK